VVIYIATIATIATMRVFSRSVGWVRRICFIVGRSRNGL